MVWINVWITMLTDTAVSEIEDTFKRFIKRDDIDIILINQNVSIWTVISGTKITVSVKPHEIFVCFSNEFLVSFNSLTIFNIHMDKMHNIRMS